MITAAGFLFTDAEILRRGNEDLLNNLEEGLIILEEDNAVVFQNTAAAQLNK